MDVLSAPLTTSVSILFLHFYSNASAECSNVFSPGAFRGEPGPFKQGGTSLIS